MLRLLLMLLVLVVPVLPTRGADSASPGRPNVVFFLVDDLGYGDLGLYGNPHVRTPQMDQFAKGAVSFTRFYVSPVCNPSRAAMMTGRYTFRTFACSDTQMDPAEVTIAEALRPAGYKTALFGKWHLGDGPTECPNAQGFEEVVTFAKGQLPAESYFDPVLLHNGKNQKFSGYCMDVWTELATDFIRKNRSQPFFLYLPVNLIHTPIIPPRDGDKPYAGMGLPTELSKTYAMTESVDSNFVRVLAALKDAGLEENTLFILGSDNGPAIHSEHNPQNDGERFGQLRGMKGDVYEGGIRTPWFMRWPAQFKGGRKIDRIAAHIDLLPTILDACRVTPPKDVALDGRSLLPLLHDPAARWSPRTIFIQWDSNYAPNREVCFAAITDEWKLVQPCGMTSKGPILGLLKRYEQLCQQLGREQRNISSSKPRFELYHIAEDPGERQDLADKKPETVTRLRKEYNAWFDDISATARWKGDPQTAGPADDAENENKPSKPDNRKQR